MKFNECESNAAKKPVRRKPRQAYDQADHCRKNNASRRDNQRIGQACQESPAKRHGRVIRNERFGDREAGRFF